MLSGIRNPMVINGVPVILAPAEIDLTTAEQLRMVLFDSAGRGHATIRPLVHQPGPGQDQATAVLSTAPVSETVLRPTECNSQQDASKGC